MTGDDTRKGGNDRPKFFFPFHFRATDVCQGPSTTEQCTTRPLPHRATARGVDGGWNEDDMPATHH